MSKSILLALSAAVALMACSAAAGTEASLAPDVAQAVASDTSARPVEADTADLAPVSCEIRSRSTSDGALIQGLAFADRDVDVEYELLITKSNRSGSADVTQGGSTSISAGSWVTLGENEIGLDRGARLRAVLVLRDSDGELCRRSLRL